MNLKLLVQTLLTIALLVIVTGCGGPEPTPQPVCLVPDVVGLDLLGRCAS